MSTQDKAAPTLALLEKCLPYLRAGLYLSEHGSKTQHDVFNAADLIYEVEAALASAQQAASSAGACPTCGSDCNERDELTKAEREIERLRAALASTQQAEPAQAAVPKDFFTHKNAWREALNIAVRNAPPPTEDTDDPGYWMHEVRAFDRAYAQLEAAQPKERAEPVQPAEAVAQVVSSGPANFPILQWMSAELSLNTPIGAKLFFHPAPTQVPLSEQDRTRALNLAYQFRSHPASRSIDEIERAGEIILALLSGVKLDKEQAR